MKEGIDQPTSHTIPGFSHYLQEASWDGLQILQVQILEMWEYKTVVFTSEELSQWNSTSKSIVEGQKRQFLERFQAASIEDQEAIFTNEYLPAIKQGIAEAVPFLQKRELPILKERTWNQKIMYRLYFEEYLEVKLNHYAQEGWELDRIRPSKQGSFTDGILIFRRKVVEE